MAAQNICVGGMRSSRLESLPAPLLQHLLQFLCDRQRLGGHTAACSTLLAAAVAITDKIEAFGISQQQADALSAWLRKHGSSKIRHLFMRVDDEDQSDTPVSLSIPGARLPQLQHLELYGPFVLQEAANSSSSSSCVSAPGGRQPAQPLESLSALTALTHLRLSRCSAAALDSSSFSAALGKCLAHMEHLEVLTLQGCSTASDDAMAASGDSHIQGAALDGAAVAGLGSLMKLQQLNLENIEGTGRAVDLPSSLTALTLCSVSGLDTSSWHLPALQSLLCREQWLKPELLMCATQLQRLTLHMPFMAHTADFLSALQALQHLEALCIYSLDFTDPEDVPAPAPEAYAALTASSHLTHLALECCELPEGAVQHMFQSGQQLPSLKRLYFMNYVEDYDFEELEWIEKWYDDAALEKHCLVIGPGDMGPLVRCCQALNCLRSVSIEAAVPVSELKALLELTALTDLNIGGAGCGDAAAEHVLSKLTGESLFVGHVYHSSSVQHWLSLFNTTQFFWLINLHLH
jgi:hypothetical protein